MSLSQSFSQKIGNVRPLNPCPSLDIDFANGGYVTDLGFANQESVGSANFKIGAFNGPDPIFARSSAATFRGSNGLIQYAPENLLAYSEDFTTTWGKPAIGVSSNVAVSPSGTTTADLIYPSSSGTAREIFVGFTYTAGISYVASVYAKYAGKQWITLGTNNGTVANRCGWFDILNGVKGQIASGYQSQIENVGNGWYRIIVIFSSSTSPYFDISIVDADGSGSVTKSGTDGAYIWGAQLERSRTARPYISTTTTARYGPRFEYDLNGNPLGLLMEEQSLNLLSYSERFDDVSWSKNRLNTTGIPSWIDAGASPNGLNTSDLIIPDATSGSHWARKPNLTVTASSYTLSFYAKAGGYNYLGVQFASDSSFTKYFEGVFNLSNGTIENTGRSLSFTGSRKIQSVGNGWYLCSITVNLADANSTTLAGIVVQSTNDPTLSFSGNGTSGVYVWGAQLEQKPFATSYMPTVTGTSTRNADVVSSTISSWFNQTEGTVVVSGDRNNNPTLNSSGLDSFFEFTGTASYLLVHACDGTTEAVYDASGSPATTVGVTIGSLTSIAASYSDVTDLLHISRNGLATQSGPSTGLGVAPTTLNIGYAPVSLIGYWNGHIKSFRYFPKALPNNLQRLSS